MHNPHSIASPASRPVHRDFHCAICRLTVHSQSNLDRHLASKRHARQAKSFTPSAPATPLFPIPIPSTPALLSGPVTSSTVSQPAASPRSDVDTFAIIWSHITSLHTVAVDGTTQQLLLSPHKPRTWDGREWFAGLAQDTVRLQFEIDKARTRLLDVTCTPPLSREDLQTLFKERCIIQTIYPCHCREIDLAVSCSTEMAAMLPVSSSALAAAPAIFHAWIVKRATNGDPNLTRPRRSKSFSVHAPPSPPEQLHQLLASARACLLSPIARALEYQRLSCLENALATLEPLEQSPSAYLDLRTASPASVVQTCSTSPPVLSATPPSSTALIDSPCFTATNYKPPHGTPRTATIRRPPPHSHLTLHHC